MVAATGMMMKVGVPERLAEKSLVMMILIIQELVMMKVMVLECVVEESLAMMVLII